MYLSCSYKLQSTARLSQHWCASQHKAVKLRGTQSICCKEHHMVTLPKGFDHREMLGRTSSQVRLAGTFCRLLQCGEPPLQSSAGPASAQACQMKGSLLTISLATGICRSLRLPGRWPTQRLRLSLQVSNEAIFSWFHSANTATGEALPMAPRADGCTKWDSARP